MVGRGHSQTSAQQGEEGLPKLPSEAGVAIGNQDPGEAMMPKDSVKIDLGQLGCGDLVGSGRHVNLLAEVVNKDDGRCMALGSLWQTSDQVQGDLFPPLVWSSERLKKSCRCLVARLIALANITRSDIGSYISIHARPPPIALKDTECLIAAKMSSDGKIMRFLEPASP